MTDPPRGDSVFAGLEVLDDNPDADAMDRMLLNLAASTDPPDWQLDSLSNDLYPTHYPPLPLQYIDTDPDPDPAPPSPPRPPKRTHTVVCPLCGKAISNNAANFRRHEAACRRARADKSSSDPSPHHTPQQTPNSNPTPSQTSPHPSSSPPSPSPPSPPLSSPPNCSRRDSDLLNVVRRLEQNVTTLDVSARVCLRDALLSLSNKASHPTVTPTPQQEAMNRAAEYLVLRMLFLSGQQLMHTPPGTAPPSFTEQQPPPAASPSDHHHHHHTEDDGTVAASTGTAGLTLPKDQILTPSVKPEDNIPDQT